MTVTLDIPDEVAERLASNGRDIAQDALEAFAMESYRNKTLGESQIKVLMGYGTRMEVHELMKKHDVYWHDGAKAFENDTKTLDWLSEQRAKRAAA